MDSRVKTEIMDEIMEIGASMKDMGLVNIFEGNPSIKDGNLPCIAPGRTSKKKLTHDSICVFDESIREKLWGGRPPSKAKMHWGAYTVKEGLHGVTHCYVPCLITHAIAYVPLDLRCHLKLLLHFKDIPMASYGMPGSDEVIENVKPCLLRRNLVLMTNHGVLNIALNLTPVCQRMVAAEKSARVTYIIRQVGGPVDIFETEIYRLLGRELEL